jgi:hypothetical protein
MDIDLKAALARIAANPQSSGDGRGYTEGNGENQQFFSDTPFSRSGSYFHGGYALTPQGDGTFLVYKPAEPGHASTLNGTMAQVVDAQGNVIGQQQLRGISDNNPTRNAIGMLSVALGGPLIGGALAGAAAGGAAGAGAGAGGAVGGAAGGAGGAAAGGLGATSSLTGGLGTVGYGGGYGLSTLGGLELGAGGIGAASYGSTVGLGLGQAALGAAAAGGGAAAMGAGGGGGGGGGGAALEGVPPPTAPGYGAPSTFGSTMQDAMGVVGGAGGAGGFNWGSLIGPALSAVGGIAGANAAGNAAEAQLQATREAAALQEPFRQGGMAAMNSLLELNGIGGNPASEGYGSAQKDFTAADFAAGKDPGYEWRKQQGQLGLERAASAKGGLGSGGYLKDAMAYNSGLASQEYQQAFNRNQVSRTAKLNPLQSLMGAGQTAANTIGGYTVDGGNAKAAGTVGQANALTGAIGQGWSMYANQQQQSQNNALMNALLLKGA